MALKKRTHVDLFFLGDLFVERCRGAGTFAFDLEEFEWVGHGSLQRSTGRPFGR